MWSTSQLSAHEPDPAVHKGVLNTLLKYPPDSLWTAPQGAERILKSSLK